MQVTRQHGSKPAQYWFSEIPSKIKYQHPDNRINDFHRQTLLISEFSHNGPKLVKYDLNNDGLEDLLIGGAGEEPTAIFMQKKNGEFESKKIPAFET